MAVRACGFTGGRSRGAGRGVIADSLSAGSGQACCQGLTVDDLIPLCKNRTVHDVRVTVAVAVVLRVFLDDIARARYGYELMRLTGFPSGKLYPVLARLERAGWLVKEREDIDPAAASRPARRLYRMSEEGVQAARYELARLSEQLRPGVERQGRLTPEGGPA